ncbi:MAG: ATP-binding protein [Acidobacteria bacterium]|nr:ATP-binding protein [Acidobacteriota bacterium]
MPDSPSSVCPECGGSGWKPVQQHGTRRVVRCDCWRVRVADRLLVQARIPKRYQHCTLDNFLVYPNELLLKAVTRARAFAEAFPVVDKGLFFIGRRPGIGKSHLAAAVLHQAITTRGARGYFYDVRELLRLIRSTFSAGTPLGEMEILRPIMDADLLVLDDLGAERSSEWVGETLDALINTRYGEKRATIFTSNYEVMEDETNIDSLQVRVGFRTYSRLLEMCEFLEFDGADFRDIGPNPGPEDLLAAWKGPRRSKLPPRAGGPMRAQLKGKTDLKWSGGKAGN